MNILRIYDVFSPYFRRRRNRIFNDIFRPGIGTTILDVGGYHWFWETNKPTGAITFLNTSVPPHVPLTDSCFRYVQGDGRHLPFPDKSFDIVFSNSVIEHLGRHDEQAQFASEVLRVGRHIWIQTPARWFPVEPHLITPLVHFLPKTIQRHLIRPFTVWGVVTKPSRQEVQNFLEKVRLLRYCDIRSFFPGCRILRERFLFLTKSYIAVR